ncbi:MAG: tetratricopeptide repeat protein, partial [Acidobacteriota bacterium]|nr:tetratricopeptide repeat protein [Acidobacteriota bacterium]
IVVSGGAPLILNLVLKSQSSVSLGEVRFDQKSGFETGELRDPTAGGGYSDSASLESARMARQYSGQTVGKAAKNHGEEMLARGEYAQAASWFLNTGRPRSARDEMGLGIAYYGQSKYDAAVETLHKAAMLAPDDAAPRLLMAEAARFATSRQAMVADSLRGFTLAHPANAEGHYAYGMVLWAIFRAQRLQSALALARTESERAVALAPGNAAAHVQLGTIYDRMNMVSEAIAQYRQALKANPDFSAAHYRLAQDLLRTGAKSEAQAQIQAYEKLEKDGGR